MTLRAFLVLMTGIAVLSDSMLHPFYPQYFERVFGVTKPLDVGLYIAACSLTVLASFPVWAWVAKRVPVMKLLIASQLAAGALSVLSGATSSLLAFWLASLGMMLFKASYLLIYPYVMSLEQKSQHLGTIGLLAFVVYFGNILAALMSGVVFQLLEPRALFSVMAVGDLVQVLLCAYWLRSRPEHAPAATSQPALGLSFAFVARLGSVMLVLYFSAYLSEPFFASYWESLAGSQNKVLSGLVFAIPGIAALIALFVNERTRYGGVGAFSGIAPAIAFGIVGLLLQATGTAWLVLGGRFLYGWALFQAMVRLDRILFRESTPDTYATDFSRVNLFQGLGILTASTTAGALVRSFDTRLPLVLAALGFALSAGLYLILFRIELRASDALGSEAANAVNEGNALT
jgi:DHA1 family multidrug resistance protein-like MFS transporter